MLWKVPREWEGETAFVVAGGPSVADQNTDALQSRKVIAINSSIYRVPFAQFLFFGDARFGRDQRRHFHNIPCRVVTCSQAIQWPGLLILGKTSADTTPLATDSRYVTMGGTSTHAAMNFAFHLGVKRIVLLGVDMQRGDDGRTHHHAPHRWPVREGCWDRQMKTLRRIAKPLDEHGVEVINTSLNSLVDWWPRMPLEETL